MNNSRWTILTKITQSIMEAKLGMLPRYVGCGSSCGSVVVRGRLHNPKYNLQQWATKRIFHRWLLWTTLHKTQPRLIQRVKKGLQPPGELLNPTIWRRLVLSLLLCPIFQMWLCTMTPKLIISPPSLIVAPGLKIKMWKCTQTQTHRPELNQVRI